MEQKCSVSASIFIELCIQNHAWILTTMIQFNYGFNKVYVICDEKQWSKLK